MSYDMRYDMRYDMKYDMRYEIELHSSPSLSICPDSVHERICTKFTNTLTSLAKKSVWGAKHVNCTYRQGMRYGMRYTPFPYMSIFDNNVDKCKRRRQKVSSVEQGL